MASDNVSMDHSDLPQAYMPHVQTLNKLYTTSKYSDLVLKCGDRTWNVHKNIICSRSEVLAMIIDNQSKEAEEGVIPIREVEPTVVHAMVDYIYNFDYKDDHGGNEYEDITSPMVFDVRVHALADQYDIPALMQLAASKFSSRAVQEWNTEGLVNAIEEIYTVAAHPDLCKIVIDVVAEHAKELFTGAFASQLQATASSIPAFRGNLSTKLATASKRPTSAIAVEIAMYRCGGDGGGGGGDIHDLDTRMVGCGGTFAIGKPMNTTQHGFSCPYCRLAAPCSTWTAWIVEDN